MVTLTLIYGTADQLGPSKRAKYINVWDLAFEEQCLLWYEKCESDYSDKDDGDEDIYENSGDDIDVEIEERN